MDECVMIRVAGYRCKPRPGKTQAFGRPCGDGLIGESASGHCVDLLPAVRRVPGLQEVLDAVHQLGHLRIRQAVQDRAAGQIEVEGRIEVQCKQNAT